MTNPVTEKMIAQLNELDFSHSNQQLEELKALIFDADISVQAKLNFLKEELSAGRYVIHSEKIAEKMLAFSTFAEQEITTCA